MSLGGIHDDFWLDPPKYENDAQGRPVYGAENPAHPSWRRMTNWHDLGRNGEYLRSTQTKWVYIHPSNNKIWHLAGPMRGREGVAILKELEGVMQPEFEILYSEGAYTIGAKPERVNYKKRTISLGVVVQPNGNAERIEEPNPFSYRLIEDSWWSSWSETVPGFLGSFTRTHGWRWLAVLLGEASKTSLTVDPGGDNASMQWNMTLHAPWPFYAKRTLTKAWLSDLENVVNNNGVAQGIIQIPNRGTWEAWPKYLVRGTGQATVQDGTDGPIVKLPKLYASDGAYMMVDTDPTKRTITTEKDPVDSQLYKYLRGSQLIDLLLHDVTASRLPAQRRIPGGIGFDGKVPPRSVAHIKVTHDNPAGSVTCIMPQNYRMAWS
ncbi:minor tail protein [Mycobacterium phage SirPhilip]|uniref:Minor tail protein n=1 Tax=Mycobacterium phage SirPhilip TaxID=2015824 RepID=A0A222ZKE3_9CAUD|nr:minor tail protein [Mycobacterium phage SirPhilip]ASR85223.1 minor tail protein [Mycobacterium phage SirPhilip]